MTLFHLIFSFLTTDFTDFNFPFFPFPRNPWLLLFFHHLYRLFVHKSIVETTGFCSFVLKIKGFLKYISVSKITPYSIISITFSSVSVIVRNFQDDCLVELLTVIQVQM